MLEFVQVQSSLKAGQVRFQVFVLGVEAIVEVGMGYVSLLAS